MYNVQQLDQNFLIMSGSALFRTSTQFLQSPDGRLQCIHLRSKAKCMSLTERHLSEQPIRDILAE